MSSAQHKHRNCLVSAPQQWQQSTTVVTYRNCAPWEKPMALYPSFNSGSWASWLHTEDTCAFTSMKKPFSVSCRRGDMKSVERDGQIGGKKTRPVQGDGLWGDKVTVPMLDQSEVERHNHTAGPWILTHGEGVKEPLSWRNMCQERCKYDRAGSLTCPVDESIPTAIKTNVIFRLKLRTPRLRSSFYGIILIFWCAKQFLRVFTVYLNYGLSNHQGAHVNARDLLLNHLLYGPHAEWVTAAVTWITCKRVTYNSCKSEGQN